jgi:protease-4
LRSPLLGIARACLALGLCACFNTIDVDLGIPETTGELEETIVLGEEGPKIALLEVAGVISDQARTGTFGLVAEPSMVAELREMLERAAEDTEVSALVLRIESPGGSVGATETLHHELLRWRAAQGRPVIAYLNGIAASGGYYVAMAADRVVAHPATVTGSIGVLMPGLGFAGLMERFGVADQSVKSGQYKDIGSATRPMSAADRAQLQGVVDDLHERFVEVVDTGRPDLDRAQASALADGRIFTARQALDAGLIDAVGYIEDAVDAAEALVATERSRVVMYHRPGRPRENIHSRAPQEAPRARAWDPSLDAGFYYLWPAALRD